MTPATPKIAQSASQPVPPPPTGKIPEVASNRVYESGDSQNCTSAAGGNVVSTVFYSIGNYGNKQGEKAQKERERQREREHECETDDTGSVGRTRLMPEFLRRG